MTPADRAREIWRLICAAAHSLAGCQVPMPSISLGPGLSDELMSELARLGGTFECYRLADEDSSLLRVWSHLNLDVPGCRVNVYAVNSRPATAADEALPLRGGRA